MSSVDNRLVKMSFDNAEFEKRASTSMGTLAKLKQALDFSGAAKGLENIKTSSDIRFDGLLESLNSIQSRFSVLGEFAHNTFLSMVNSAVDAGKQITEALTITPAKEGFEEYELKMGSIQTIMAGSGESLKVVNQKLNELNEYADKTIYSFSDMTNSIGKFTNAGVDLDTAVSAIKGISNATALAGGNAQQAQSAMFNMSQALSAGYLGLVDWRSISLTAGIGTEEFRRQLIDTAVAMGTLKKEGDKYVSTTTDLNGNVSDAFDVFENFDNSLKSRWATKDVLMQAMSNFGTDVREMTAAEKDAYETQLMSIYGDKEKVKHIIEIGQKAADASKDIKTFSQMIDTLKEALGTGWATSWEYIVGDFEEAKKLWTDVYSVLESYINASSDARNKSLKEWHDDVNGRAAVIAGMENIFKSLLSIVTPLGEAFKTVFGSITGNDLINISTQFREFTKTLILTKDQAEVLKNVAIGVFNSIKSIFEGFKNIGTTVLDIFGAIGKGIINAVNPDSVSQISNLADKFRQFTEAIKPSEATLTSISKLVTGVVSVFRALGSAAISAGSALFDSIGKVFSDLIPTGTNFMELIGKIGDWLTNLASKFESTFNYDAFAGGFNSMADAIRAFISAFLEISHLDGVLNWLKNLFSIGEEHKNTFDFLPILADWVDKIGNAIKEFVSGIDLSKIDFLEILKKLFEAGILKKIYDRIKESKESKDVINDFWDLVKNFTENITENLETVKNSLVDTLTSLQTSVNSNAILKIGIAIGILTASLAKLASIDSGSLAKAMTALTGLFIEIGVFTNQLANIKLADPTALSTISTTMLKISAAILILAEAVAKLAAFDAEALGRGIFGITVLLGEMIGVAAAFSKMNGELDKGAGALIKFAAAIWVLTEAVAKMAEIPADRLRDAVIAISALIAELVVVAAALSNNKIVQDPSQISKASTGLIIFGAAVKVLISSVKDLAQLDMDQLKQGLTALTVIMAELVVVAVALSNNKLIQNPEQLNTVARSLVVFSAAVKIIASVVKDFATMDLNSMIQGLAGLAAILAGLVISAKQLSGMDLSGLNEAALGLAAFVGSVKAIAEIIKSLSTLSLPDLIEGIAGMAAAMASLVIVAKIFSSPDLDPARIAAVSAALLIFSASMAIITASMGAMAALGLEGIVIALIGMAGALAVFGAAAVLLGPVAGPMAAVAASMMLFGAGLALVGVGIGVATAGIALLVATLVGAGASIGLVLDNILSFISRLGTALGEMFVGFATKIAENGPTLIQATSEIIQSILIALQENIPEISRTIFELLTSLLEQLAEYVPRMAEAGLKIIRGLLEAIANNLPQILDAGITIALEFIKGITQRLPEIIDTAFKLVIQFIDGLATAIEKNHNALFEAVGHLIKAIVEAIIDGVKMVADAAGKLLLGENGNDGVLGAIGGFFQDMFDAGANLVKGFIDGLVSMPGALWDAACGLANDAWNAITGTLDEHSPSRLTFGGGVNFVLGFINGIISLKERVKEESAATAFAALDSFNDNIDSESIYSPVITPVIDLSNVQNGIDSIDDMVYSIPDTYDISANIMKNNKIPNEMLNVMSSPSDYSSIISRMDSLESNFSELIGQLSRMKIVLDSGELVGAMAPGIDTAMGMRATLSSRGVF